MPSDGAWAVPSFHPVDATWTSGRTTVVLDDLRAVRECRERAGRLVPTARNEADPDNRLTFEEEAPRSVADLVFIRPGPQVACTVLGHLVLGGTRARLDCRLNWVLHRGAIPQMEVDLSSAWLPDQVRIPGLDEPVAWHYSELASGVIRLRVMLPASVLERGVGTLSIGATSTATAGRGPLELPRVRPRGAAIVDEAWLAWVDDGTTIQPVHARGLAWIDPRDVPGLGTAPPSAGLHEALAWRWTADRGEARVDRERVDQDPRASIRTRARIAADGRGLSLEGTILIGSGAAPLEALPIWVDGPGDALASWHFSTDDGVELRPRAIEGADRTRAATSGASTRELPVNLPALAERAVRFRAERPWSSPGVVPLLFVPREFLKGGTVLLETPAGMKVRPRTAGLGRLDPSSIERFDPVAGAGTGAGSGGSPASEAPAAGERTVQAFSYPEPGARLELETESLEAAPMPGVVREALLTTRVDPRGRTLNRLRLVTEVEGARPLLLDLPEGATLVRVRRDGASVVPTRSGGRIAIPAPAAGAGAGIRPGTIVFDYLVEAGAIVDGSALRPAVPRFDLPCLSFAWEVVTPPGWRVLEPGPGLVANDPDDPAGWPFAVLGMSLPRWSLAESDGDYLGGQHVLMTRDSQDMGRHGLPPRSLAEWFGQWDAGSWPILVVDRLALSSAGLGPRSPRVDGGLGWSQSMSQQGLAAVTIGDAIVITTETERSRFVHPDPWRDAVGEALAWGRDRSDRFQTVERWRDEVSPRGTGGESDEATRPAPGRQIRRFSAAGWPGEGAFVNLVDGRRRAAVGWTVAASVTLAWLGLVALGRSRGHGQAARLVLLAAAAIAGVVCERVLPARYGSAAAGGFVAALALLIAELARRLRRRPALPPRVAARAGSSLLRGPARPASVPGLVLVPILVLAAGGSMAALSAGPAADPPAIVALFPYEGTFDPSRPMDRVILRLEDYRRLVRRGREAEAPASPGSVIAVKAAHRVVRQREPEVLVETELELLRGARAVRLERAGVVGPRDLGRGRRPARADRRGRLGGAGEGDDPRRGATPAARPPMGRGPRRGGGFRVDPPAHQRDADGPPDGRTAARRPPPGHGRRAEPDPADAGRLARGLVGPGRPAGGALGTIGPAGRRRTRRRPRRWPDPLGRDPGRRSAAGAADLPSD